MCSPPTPLIGSSIRCRRETRISAFTSTTNPLTPFAAFFRDFQKLRSSPSRQPFACFVEPILGPGAFVVRGLFFDKTPRANWKVSWHQDLTIAVRVRIEAPGFGPWSLKAGVVHVQPPAEILERMATVRLHLDDCSESNGPLR